MITLFFKESLTGQLLMTVPNPDYIPNTGETVKINGDKYKVMEKIISATSIDTETDPQGRGYISTITFKMSYMT